MKPSPLLFAIAFWATLGGLARAEGGLSALEALAILENRMGVDSAHMLVAMNGQLGQDQPAAWTILTLDSESPNLSREYQVDEGGVRDEGAPAGIYSRDVPPGFIDRTQLRIDSPEAFRTLDGEASRARIGFNSVNYTLVARDYGREAVWQVEAVDVRGRTVGWLDLSASTGEVFRRVWYYYDDASSTTQGSTTPHIFDSLIHGRAAEGSPRASDPARGATAQGSTAPPSEQRPPAAVRPQMEREEEEKERGGLFSRLRRGSRFLRPGGDESPEPSGPSSSTMPTSPTVEVAPVEPSPPSSSSSSSPPPVEEGRAIELPPGQGPSPRSNP